MTEFTLRPSLKRAKLGFALAVLALAAIIYFYLRYQEHLAWWVLFAGLLPFSAPLAGWLDTKRTKLTVKDGVLKQESGILSRKTRLVPLKEISGISIERSFSQRLWGTGTLVVETRGHEGRLVLNDVDNPKRCVDMIRAASVEPGTAGAWNQEKGIEGS